MQQKLFLRCYHIWKQQIIRLERKWFVEKHYIVLLLNDINYKRLFQDC